MIKKLCVCGLWALWLVGCSDDVVAINYKLNEPVDLDLYCESYYSTVDLEGVEQVGTITAAYTSLNYSTQEDTVNIDRKYIIDKSRGYLKNYMPSELAWRAKEVKTIGLDRAVLDIQGLEEGYDALVNSLPMPDKWRNQLLNPDYKPHLARAEKHRYEMDHLLTGSVPVKGNVTKMLEDQGRLNFALIKVDSVVTDGYHNLDKRKCLGYTVYLHEFESFPYFIWEQHVNGKWKNVPEKYMHYQTGHKGDYSTAFWIAIDPTTGIPCQEREVKVGTHTMVNAAINDTATFTSHITLERLYTVKRPEDNAEEK
ncbi:MAG: hypothetical protein HUK21_03400 [Fibrobacteraceae bacterium]|nr:hypothetical protein [Fibrobacteraceae bacterium]